MSKAENSKKEKLKALKKAEKKMKKRKNHTAKKIAAGAGITVAVLLAAGYGAVGYQSQSGQHAALPAAGRRLPGRGDGLLSHHRPHH